MMLGNVRSDEGDSNQNVKKAIGMIKKTTNLPIHSHFLGYISLPSLYDFDEKMPISRFTGDANNYRRISFVFLNLDVVLRNSTPGGFKFCQNLKNCNRD